MRTMKKWRRFAFAIFTADHAGAVALRVNPTNENTCLAIPVESRGMPLSRNPDLINAPKHFSRLQPFNPLRLGFL